MTTRIMHRCAVKFPALLHRMLASRWHRSMIALAIVEMMIHVPVEMSRPAIPGSCADEYTAREPFRPVITIRSAVVGRGLIVSIRANRRGPNVDRNLRLCAITGSQEKAETKNQNTHPS